MSRTDVIENQLFDQPTISYQKPSSGSFKKEKTTAILAFGIIGGFIIWHFLLLGCLTFSTLRQSQVSLESLISYSKDVFTLPVGIILGYYFSRE